MRGLPVKFARGIENLGCRTRDLIAQQRHAEPHADMRGLVYFSGEDRLFKLGVVLYRVSLWTKTRTSPAFRFHQSRAPSALDGHRKAADRQNRTLSANAKSFL